MNRLRTWIEKVYEERIQREYDNMVLVVGDEGVGKSTLILHCIAEYQRARGIDFGADTIIDRTAWDQADFKQMMAEDEPRTAIAVHDAARVLHKREAMHPDQIEVEKDLLDARIREHLINDVAGFDVLPISDRRVGRHPLADGGRSIGINLWTIPHRLSPNCILFPIYFYLYTITYQQYPYNLRY